MIIGDLIETEPINFIESPWHYLSPFSAHQIKVDEKIYPTLEHAYQAMRLKSDEQRSKVQNCPSPLEAWRLGQKYKINPNNLVSDYDKTELMERLMRLKLKQHPDIAAVLLESGGRGLHKVFGTDYFWGTGHDGSGQNIMGKLWMKLRDELVNARN